MYGDLLCVVLVVFVVLTVFAIFFCFLVCLFLFFLLVVYLVSLFHLHDVYVFVVCFSTARTASKAFLPLFIVCLLLSCLFSFLLLLCVFDVGLFCTLFAS